MANPSVSYEFESGEPAVASEVNQNFNDLLAFVNGEVIHRDGSVAMTGGLVLPAADPSSANQATRMAYVNAEDNKRPRLIAAGSTLAGSSYNSATHEVRVRTGTASINTGSQATATISLGGAFPNGLGSFIVHDAGNTPTGTPRLIYPVGTYTTNSAVVKVFTAALGGFGEIGTFVPSTNTGPFIVSYMAVGW